MKPYIISISAVSGGGKTAITNALTHSLNKAVAFYFDEYEYSKQPDDMYPRTGMYICKYASVNSGDK